MLSGKQLAEIKLSSLPKIGEKRAELFHKIGIYNLFDLLYYFPRRYEDRRFVERLDGVASGEQVTVWGRIINVEEVKVRRNLSLLRVAIQGSFGKCTAIWFNQPFLKRSLRRGLLIAVTGKVERNLYGCEISVNDYEAGSLKNPVHVGRIVPIYSSTENLSQRFLRRIIYQCVRKYANNIKNHLPDELIRELNLLPISQALMEIHFPRDEGSLQRARESLVYEELFLFQTGLNRIHEQVRRQGVARRPQTTLPEDFLKKLPYTLTEAQRKAMIEIRNDLSSTKRMYRLLQGDVGCGKTVVALYALLFVVASGFQGALMAPTEVLAEQHFLSISKLVSGLGVNVDLLTGSLGKKEKEQCLQSIKSGMTDIVVGTHALLEDDVVFNHLGLVVIDEQHRFGVQQRDLLLNKAAAPDVLVMTATPIPRSLTLTVYGDLDLTIINELPPGRKKIKTFFLPAAEKSRVYSFARKELEAGRQVYVVCPLIQESEHLAVEAAVKRYEELCQEFSAFNVGLIHGKLKIDEKDKVMDAFRRGEIDLLVATSVIEVGIDVPNASVIIIEGVERFGLSQLHQLRGRVGRGSQESYCVLVGNPNTREAIERIKIMLNYHDGFQVAEKDLALRGPGELLGSKQHGYSDFRVVDIIKDLPHFLKLKKFSNITNNDQHGLWEEINFRFPSLFNVLKI